MSTPTYPVPFRGRTVRVSVPEPRIEAYGVRGLRSTPWRRTFANGDALAAWVEKHDAQVLGSREVES